MEEQPPDPLPPERPVAETQTQIHECFIVGLLRSVDPLATNWPDASNLTYCIRGLLCFDPHPGCPAGSSPAKLIWFLVFSFEKVRMSVGYRARGGLSHCLPSVEWIATGVSSKRHFFFQTRHDKSKQFFKQQLRTKRLNSLAELSKPCACTCMGLLRAGSP